MIVGQPHFKYYGDGLFILTKGFAAYQDGWEAQIPVGTITNGASIPKMFRNLFNPVDEEWFIASVIHDALIGEYNHPVTVRNDKGVNKELSWKESAKFFKGIMRELGAPKWKQWLFYQAVMLKKRVKR